VADFRFENLEVWKMATEIGHRLGDLAEELDSKNQGFHANSLRKRSCQISGILAEGSSCPGKFEFASFVGEARGATLSIANQIIFLAGRDLISETDEADLVGMLKREAKMLENFRSSLERADRPDTILAER